MPELRQNYSTKEWVVIATERARTKADRRRAPVIPSFEWGDALELPYAEDSFDAATVGFGARNFDDLAAGLREMVRVVKPGGRVVVLEITTPTRQPLSLFYGVWFDRMVPAIGRLAGAVSAMTAMGSVTLPSRFDILRPCSSLMWPRTMQVL